LHGGGHDLAVKILYSHIYHFGMVSVVGFVTGAPPMFGLASWFYLARRWFFFNTMHPIQFAVATHLAAKRGCAQRAFSNKFFCPAFARARLALTAGLRRATPDRTRRGGAHTGCWA
jgi:hypothetical protein